MLLNIYYPWQNFNWCKNIIKAIEYYNLDAIQVIDVDFYNDLKQPNYRRVGLHEIK